jgi:ribulose 1,5-bisphosphate carboxylase large subunit-like protein
MTITNCGKCNKLIKDDEIFQNHDYAYYCEKCYLENELKDTIQEYSEKKQWLKETHLRHLIKLQRKMSVLKMKIGLLQ